MNTFTFTDDEIEVVESALRQYSHNLSSFNKLLIDSGVSFQEINKNMTLAHQSLIKLERAKEGRERNPQEAIDDNAILASEFHRLTPEYQDKILEKYKIITTKDGSPLFARRIKEKQ